MAKLIEKIKDKRAPEPETPARRDIPVVHPAPEQGLTSAQVRERTDAGWTNAPVDPPGKTVKQIVLSNIFTYFNMLFFLLALCVIPTGMLQLHARLQSRMLRRSLLVLLGAFTGFMVIGRLLSGVHWLTDIIGGVLLSAGLVLLYQGLSGQSLTG